MVTIKEIINTKYKNFESLCKKNIVRRVEITDSSSFKAIEEIDLLHDMMIRWLKRKTEYETIEAGFQQLKKEFLTEKNVYTKMAKPNTLSFVELIIKDDNNKENEAILSTIINSLE